MLDLFKLLPNQDILFKINELCSNDKGYSRDYIRFIVNCRMKLFADLFDKSKTREEYIDEIKKLLRDEKVYYIEKSLINYETYNVLFSDSDVVKSSIALRYTLFEDLSIGDDVYATYSLYDNRNPVRHAFFINQPR